MDNLEKTSAWVNDIVANAIETEKTDSKAYAKALSWLIKGNQTLASELSKGTFEEIVNALSVAFDMVGVAPFLKAASLTRNASLLAATPK